MANHTACLCAIAKNEVPYIVEWTNYHLAIGFSHIYLYDNEDTDTLAPIFAGRNNVTVTHFPGKVMQYRAYNHFLCSQESHIHHWCGFLDIDEFLVLKKHNDVLSFLKDHCSKGIMSLNWFIYGENASLRDQIHVDTEDVSIPVTKRFILREPLPNKHVKCLFVREEVFCIYNAHYPLVFNPDLKRVVGIDQKNKLCPILIMSDDTRIVAPQHDTNGKHFIGPFNDNGPTDIAYINHYYFRSKTEYSAKYNSLGADGMTKGVSWACHPTRNDYFDDSARIFYLKSIEKSIDCIASDKAKEKDKPLQSENEQLLLYIVCHDDTSETIANDLIITYYPYGKVIRVPNNSPYFESEVFLELAKPEYKNEWNSGRYAYVGVITYSFVKKVGPVAILDELNKLVQRSYDDNTQLDVASILNLDFGKGRVNRSVSFVESISMQHGPFLWLAISKLLKTLSPTCRQMSELDMLDKKAKGFFSNWFVAKPIWMDRYIKFYSNARRLCKINPDIVACLKEDSYYIGQKTMSAEQLTRIFGRPQYGLEPFLFERLTPLFFHFEGAKVVRFQNPAVVNWGLCD